MHDLVTLGEVLLRLAIPSPARFETARALDVQIGGAEANVAAACARLGLRTAWISALPDNPWGERVRRDTVLRHLVDDFLKRFDFRHSRQAVLRYVRRQRVDQRSLVTIQLRETRGFCLAFVLFEMTWSIA